MFYEKAQRHASAGYSNTFEDHSKGDTTWQNKDLAYELFISTSEISESLNRSSIAGLLNGEKKKVHERPDGIP